MSGSGPKSDRAGDALRRIAGILNLPVGVFHEAADRHDRIRTDAASADAQRAELIALYDALRDPRSKRLCIDCVRRLLESEKNSVR